MLFNYLNYDLLSYGIVASGLLAIGFSLHYFIDYNSASDNISDYDYLNTDLNTTSNVYSSVDTQTIPESMNTSGVDTFSPLIKSQTEGTVKYYLQFDSD
jgi:hypothetical protein